MTRKRTDEAQAAPTGTSAGRMKQLAAVAKDFAAWKPARSALERVRAVQTIFPSLNVATRVGGWPLQRIAVVHGPSNNGKTALVHGLGLSFLRAGHYYAYVDAEMTTPIDWVERLMGAEMAGSPAFQALRPTTYEATVDAVRGFVETISKARSAGRLPADTSALIAVDSLRKLVPERLREKILKGSEGTTEKDRRRKSGGVDGLGGRAAQYKAFLNSAWLDELVPLMAHGNTTIVIVGREAENDDPFAEDWKLTGGKGLEFDSSLIIRVAREGWTKRGDDVVGERLLCRIRKTKIAGKDNKVVDCYIHLSNGAMIPEGFDRARDVIEMARQCGVVEQKGAWLHVCDTGESWQGESAAVEALTKDAGQLRLIEEAVMQIMLIQPEQPQ